jgi:hypothetical protein
MRAGVLSVGRWAGVLEQGGNPPAVMKVIGTKVPHGAWDPQRRG